MATGGKNESPARSGKGGGGRGKDDQSRSLVSGAQRAKGKTVGSPSACPLPLWMFTEKAFSASSSRYLLRNATNWIYHLGRFHPHSPLPTLFPVRRESHSYSKPGFIFTLFLGPHSSKADNGAGNKTAESLHLPKTELQLRTWAQASAVASYLSSVFEAIGCIWILGPLFMSPVSLGNHFSVPHFFCLLKGDNNRIYIR